MYSEYDQIWGLKAPSGGHVENKPWAHRLDTGSQKLVHAGGGQEGLGSGVGSMRGPWTNSGGTVTELAVAWMWERETSGDLVGGTLELAARLWGSE